MNQPSRSLDDNLEVRFWRRTNAAICIAAVTTWAAGLAMIGIQSGAVDPQPAALHASSTLIPPPAPDAAAASEPHPATF